jgi:hypothetical protein
MTDLRSLAEGLAATRTVSRDLFWIVPGAVIFAFHVALAVVALLRRARGEPDCDEEFARNGDPTWWYGGL